MGRIIYTILASLALITQANAAWYWPFGSEEAEKPVRMSELMEDASVLVDSAADFAAEGKIPEAIEAYNKAFAELERIERENPERAATSEFSTVRNKKAYVTAAIDSLLLSQATNNARTVAVTDTTELEKKLAEEEAAKEAAKKTVESGEKQVQVKKTVVSESKKLPPTVEKVLSPAKKSVAAETPSGRKSKLMLAAADYAKKDYAAAMLTLKELLKERADDVAALNLKAAVELAEGNVKAAEESLHRSIRSNPRSHYAYYNLARLILETRGPAGKSDARRYYENGREYCAGPVDKTLEEALK